MTRDVRPLVGYAAIDRAICDAFPSLRMIATTSAGFDMADVVVVAHDPYCTGLP